jgi:hypothetical protein
VVLQQQRASQRIVHCTHPHCAGLIKAQACIKETPSCSKVTEHPILGT